jgi:hypothetical protein
MRRLIPFVLTAAGLALASCSDVHRRPLEPEAGRAVDQSAAKKPVTTQAPQLVADLGTELASAQGSTVGPGGALYVTEPASGEISRIDPRTGAVTTFASGLPTDLLGPGSGVVDVAFIGATAYVLITGVGPDVGGDYPSGIYRVDGPGSLTLVADIAAFSVANPPATPFELASGFQYALEPYRGGFLVTDGHLNRVLQVTRDGEVTERIAFGDVVPTGLAVSGNTVYLAQAGPVPHLPQTGMVVAFGPTSTVATTVAAGAPLLVDVEFGLGRTLFALSQGPVAGGAPPGSPAQPGTGALLRVDGNGTFTTITAGLDRPTSLEIIGNTAYVVTLTGEVWRIDDIAAPPYGTTR